MSAPRVPPASPETAPTPADLAHAAKSFASIIARRLLAPPDFAAADRELHAARVSGDRARVRAAEFQRDLAAGFDAAARADSADVLMLMLRDALQQRPGALAVALCSMPPVLALLGRVESLESRAADLEKVLVDAGVVA